MTDGPRDKKVGDPEPTVTKNNKLLLDHGLVVEVTIPNVVTSVIFNEANDAQVL